MHNKSKVHQRKLYEKGHRRNKVSIKFLILEATIEGAQADNNQATPPPAPETATPQVSESAVNGDEQEEDCPW